MNSLINRCCISHELNYCIVVVIDFATQTSKQELTNNNKVIDFVTHYYCSEKEEAVFEKSTAPDSSPNYLGRKEEDITKIE